MSRATSPFTVDLQKVSAILAARDVLNKTTLCSAAATLDDKEILHLQPLCREWKAGESYAANEPITYNGSMYIVIQTVTGQAHQPPDGEGMLAIYRPLNQVNTGTADDPIPFVYGTDCVKGKHYSYEGKLYLCKADLPACVWYPGHRRAVAMGRSFLIKGKKPVF